MSVGDRIKQRKAYESVAHGAVIGLQVAAAYVEQLFGDVCAKRGITLEQYNVLRILRGAEPHGHPRYEIRNRLVRRASDVTRLLDRLERMGLVERVRSGEDRRLSISRITTAGLAVLDDVEPERREMQAYIVRDLTPDDLRDLTRICDAIVP
jgi:DNA-binding MarR family transcriptional regulator